MWAYVWGVGGGGLQSMSRHAVDKHALPFRLGIVTVTVTGMVRVCCIFCDNLLQFDSLTGHDMT